MATRVSPAKHSPQLDTPPQHLDTTGLQRQESRLGRVENCMSFVWRGNHFTEMPEVLSQDRAPRLGEHVVESRRPPSTTASTSTLNNTLKRALLPHQHRLSSTPPNARVWLRFKPPRTSMDSKHAANLLNGVGHQQAGHTAVFATRRWCFGHFDGRVWMAASPLRRRGHFHRDTRPASCIVRSWPSSFYSVEWRSIPGLQPI